jgi:hypothetical protein
LRIPPEAYLIASVQRDGHFVDFLLKAIFGFYRRRIAVAAPIALMTIQYYAPDC